jgi:octaprenyl-diphosphate synthase
MKFLKEKMNAYKKEAIEILYEFQDSPVRKALEDLVNYSIDRKY